MFERATNKYAGEVTNVPMLGSVEFLPVREVWDSEANSFTPWLLENEGELARVLGIDLELNANEHKVGSFSLDLFGTNLSDNTRLIVENQLEKTDHSHLGQLMTYAGGLEPSTIVWIASEFRDEHRAALDWLNAITDESVHFFGIVVKAVRIGSSPPAPWLELVVKPNEWTEVSRRAERSSSLTDSEERYLRFWEGFLNSEFAAADAFRGKKPNARHYLVLASGVGGCWIGLNIQRRKIYADLYFYQDASRNAERFEHLFRYREKIEATFGAPLSWEPLDDAKAARIGYYGEGSLMDEPSWQIYYAWLGDVANRFLRVTELEEFKAIRSIG